MPKKIVYLNLCIYGLVGDMENVFCYAMLLTSSWNLDWNMSEAGKTANWDAARALT